MKTLNIMGGGGDPKDGTMSEIERSSFTASRWLPYTTYIAFSPPNIPCHWPSNLWTTETEQELAKVTTYPTHNNRYRYYLFRREPSNIAL
jgi:hypothetical protein